jgi:hypothetical protein
VTRLSSTEYLNQCVNQLNDACRWLQRSYDKCHSFYLSQALSDDQYDDLENLSSRFARVTDILLNKVYRALDTAELMPPGSLIDTVNRAVKRGVLESAEIARTVKDIRNEIVHEYTVEDLKQLQEEVIAYTKVLLQLAASVNDYVSAEF